MSTWYVRPDTSHSGTRNGTGYATAWGGWSEITWGVGGVVGGDTLYVCGALSSATTLTVGAHGGSAGSECTIRGDYAGDAGSIAITVAGQFFSPRSHTIIRNLTCSGVSRTLYASGTVTNLSLLDNVFNGGTNPIFAMDGANGTAYTGITIDGNTFNGGSSAAEGVGAAISWFVAATNATSTLTRMTVSNNVFSECNADGLGRAVVHFRTESDTNAASVMTDVKVTDNTFTNVRGVAIEAIDGHNTVGPSAGIRVIDNVINSQTENAGALGGACSVGGFINSTTAGFGVNEFSGNKFSGLQGPSGGFNLFYGTYRVVNNTGDTFSTTTIDGNGVLFDHGCVGCSANGNRFTNLVGKAGVFNSGVGIMVLDATEIRVSGNIVDGATCGMLLGSAGSGQSCTITSNTFVGIEGYAIYAGASADLANCTVKNNVFVGDGYSVYDLTATAWSLENNNCFYGFASGASNHTLGAQSITSNPLLDASYRPRPGSPVIGAGIYIPGAKHFGGLRLRSPADIGAYRYAPPLELSSSRAIASHRDTTTSRRQSSNRPYR